MGKITCSKEEFERLLFDVILEAKIVGIKIAESADGCVDEDYLDETINKLRCEIVWEYYTK